MTAAPEPEQGWVDAALEEELPELRLWTLPAGGPPARRSPPELRERLGMLASRMRGAEAVELRRRPVPHAYRVFFRQIGLDPDEQRTPAEEAVMRRLIHGGFESHGALEDALLLAVVETGVPVWALDDATLDGPLGLRTARAGERRPRADGFADELPAGRLVVADAAGPVAVLFGEPDGIHEVTKATERIRLFSLQVGGVPDVHVEEALWTVLEAAWPDAGEARPAPR
jgi:DNA/RNA-binding domain of Phe-tRNA-synthetase-like protein